MVETPYFSGLSTIIEWLQHHITVVSILNLSDVTPSNPTCDIQ